MTCLFATFAVVVAMSASVPDEPAFDDRVAVAKAFEATSNGRAYQRRLFQAAGQAIGDAMRLCSTAERMQAPFQFVLVATVDPTGSARRVQVTPQNAFTECFGKQYQSISLPIHQFESGVPVVLEMDIVP